MEKYWQTQKALIYRKKAESILEKLQDTTRKLRAKYWKKPSKNPA
jgi:hypothetical protein